MKPTALITGANRGIGLAVAKGLLQRGYTVIATSRRASTREGVLRELGDHGEVYFQALDITRLPSFKEQIFLS